MAEPLILDPNEPSGFRVDGGGGGGHGGHGGGIEILNDPIDVGRFDDVDPFDNSRGSRPSMAQRMSDLNIRSRDRRESKSNIKSKRDSVISKPPDKYMFYRLEKYGDDWEAARKNKLAANQSEMAKQVRKWAGSVLKESRVMSELRQEQLKRLVDDANADEDGDGVWEVAWLESDKVKTKDGIKCRRMDVILGRSTKSRERSKSGGEIVDISQPSKSKSKDKDKRKEKDRDRDDGGKEHKRKDSVLDDPFQESVLFHRTGKPMDDRGPIEFSNAGLPPEIPRDRPIGKMPEKEKKEGRRGKSRDRGDDDGDIVRVDEMMPDGVVGDSIDAILRGDRRSRGGSRAGEPFEPIEVEAGRSRSRRRPSRGGRSRSRPRSQSRPESIRFPPSYYQNYMDERVPSDAISSTSSGESRYGLDREERSSYTSQDTFHDMTGRGTHYDDAPKYHRDKYGEKVYYKEHHRGPSMSRSRGASESRGPGTPKYYPGPVDAYAMPANSRRRSSRAYYAEPIPEQRQIGYNDDPRRSGTMVRRSTYDSAYDHDRRDPPLRNRDVKLHYPDDMVDLKAQERYRYAEDYQKESVKDEFMDRKEGDIRRRESRMDGLEWEREQRRYSRYDDPYGQGGGYYR